MDAIALLKRQHKEVKGLFKKVEKAERANERRQPRGVRVFEVIRGLRA